MLTKTATLALSFLLSASSLAACAAAPPAPAAQAPVVEPPRGPDASRFHALLLNGGGNPNINFQPHLLHLKALREMLVSSGVPAAQIDVLSGDGADPAPDLAVRAEQPERDFWMLTGTSLEHTLETPKLLVSSEIPGTRLRPATKAELTAWFATAARAIPPGDVLLLYVTDHGLRTGPDPMTNTIMLWGKDERISVRELGELIDGLAPGVRVVSLMSQCYSGAFANLSNGRPNVCGYFSSTADRPAYGCFPQNQGKEHVGHSFQLMRALGSTRRLDEAHAAILAEDDTPDVPIRSSDVYLEDLLRKLADARAVPVEALAAELLGTSWRDDPASRGSVELMNRVGAAFGIASPRSFADLDEPRRALPELQHKLGGLAGAWKGALADATTDNLHAFLNSRSDWSVRIAEPALKDLDAPARRALTGSLLADLAPFVQKNKEARLDLVHGQAEATATASYRTDVRLAAALRMRTLLMTLAGRAYVATKATPAERAGYDARVACEDLTLPGVPHPATDAPLRASFPPLADDVRTAETGTPGWIGIAFADVRADLRKKQGLPDGATLISAVYPDSPAKAAGVEVGDIVLGPPGKPFSAHNQIRLWSMLSPVGEPGAIEVLRGKDRVELKLTPIPRPAVLPPLPVPSSVAVGAEAPTIDWEGYHGAKVSLRDGKPHLLYFWATWCGPCKAALPELVAFEREHKGQVVAITDEAPEVLDAFFAKWKDPFPKTIVIDDLRKSFTAFGASGTPTFVLVDGKGVVRSHTVGYGREKGVGAPGWTWAGAGPKAK